jgi:hypothetical protein
MLYLFDRSYRKGDPKMMHVRTTPGACFCSKWTSFSTALKLYWTSMEGTPVFKSMLTNTISSSTAMRKSALWRMSLCKPLSTA